ncbi:protein-export membrane protein SecD [Scopulibacillus darangshiensis]|uniref:Protein translocase subunit SecD n=1 Tax=Scopulibacillus darangshiensis TaxID=442528 RepID=A0A4R2PEB2_9BACL|nr:protein-export membrane protein SecD [Scopulibacillus darangshiensis]
MVKKGRIVSFFAILVVLAVIIGFTIQPIIHNVKLGLDLKGGFEVLYQVKPLKEGQKVTNDTLKNAVAAINKRINVLGVSEPEISIEKGHRIRVQLPGVKDQKKARKLLSTTANLTFRDVNDNVVLDGSDLQAGKAKIVFNDLNKPIVSLKLKDADKFAKVTKKISSMPPGQNLMVIWLDYNKGDSYKEESQKKDPKYISAPSVNKVLNTKDVVIEGQFTMERATTLKDLLNAGSLPVKMKEIYSTSVGAQFGQDAMQKTVFAGIIGIAAIFLFMLLFYRFGGFIAILTLIVYIYLVLAVFVGMKAVLTLPGIAALILGVGMAVDANIITLERIKEEIRSGKTILSAFRAGNRRSLGTIFDANLTTIIAAAVMFVYGTSAVKGFAVMLIVSIVVSFITAVYGARLFLWLWVQSQALNKKPGYFGVKKGDISDL